MEEKGQLRPEALGNFILVRLAGRLPNVIAPMLALTLQVAALSWVVTLVIDPAPLETAPALLVGVGILGMSTVATVGIIVVGGRWAHLLGFAAIATGAIIAVIRPIDVMWVISVALTALALVALLSPALTKTVRKLPAASGPPPRAVTPPLVLLATPAILGFLGNDAPVWPLVIVSLSAPSVALLYSRVWPGGLLAIRLIWPLVAITLAPVLGWAPGIASATLGVVVAILSWGQSVKASYHPPQESGTMFPIPPELAPGDVLDAAELDDRGRRK